MGSLKLVADTVRKVPTSVFLAVAVMLLALGGIWWLRTAPPAAATADSAPIDRLVTVRLDDGRVLTYQTGRPLISNPNPTSLSDPANQRRYCRRSAAQYPNVRLAGPDMPPVFLTRCG